MDTQSTLTIATLSIAVTTFILAVVTVFQDWLRSLIWHPNLEISATTGPPDCISVPAIRLTQQPNQQTQEERADAIFLRVFIANSGREAARAVEVYAKELVREQAAGSWTLVKTFPPMNLRWTWFPTGTHLPFMNPGTGRHCDIAHIIDPSHRASFGEENPILHLTPQQVSLAFDVVAPPNNRAHIVQPGKYRLLIEVSAENATPARRLVEVTVRGPWYSQEETMLSDGVGIAVLR